MASFRRATVVLLCCRALLHSALTLESTEATPPTETSNNPGGISDENGLSNIVFASGSNEGGGANSGGSGGSGSGSDSGEKMMEEEEEEGGMVGEECYDPLTTDEGEGDDITHSTAYTATTCSLLCMEYMFNSSAYEGVSRQIGSVWRFHYFPEFESTQICVAYRKFAECVRGCLVRVDPQTANLRRNKCRNACKNECGAEYQINSHYNPYCSDCDCRQGCDNYENIVRMSGLPGSPPSPISAPEINQTDINGEFSVSLSHSAPTANDQGHPPSPVGVVYRIQDQNTQVTKYLFQVDPEEPLRLQDFACRNVSVSFVVVNKYGASNESSRFTLRVPGAPVRLTAPTNIEVSSRVDIRLGFFGHAVLDITWQHPPGYVQGLYKYRVDVIHSHGNYSSPLLNTTTLNARSETERDPIFLLGNRLEIQVFSIARDEEESETEVYRVPDFNSLVPSVVNITRLLDEWNGSVFEYTLHWEVPDYIAFGSEIFSYFVLLVTKNYSGNILETMVIEIVQKQPNQTSYSFTLTKDFEPLPPHHSYKFDVSIQWKDSDIYRRPRVQNDVYYHNGVPPPPSPVQKVTISELQFLDDNIKFTVHWNPPLASNGQVINYMACLGGRQLHDPAATDENDTKFTQVFIAQTGYIPRQGYYLVLQENDDNKQQVCLQTNGIVGETVYINIITAHTNATGYTPAIAGYDYKTTTHTIVFEPSNETISQQQCLEIEIIDDSLPEDWEEFTLLFSTNNSAVDLTTPSVDVYIPRNDVTQVFIAQTGYIPRQGYHLVLQENDDSKQQVCLQTNGIVGETVYINIITAHTNAAGYTPAIAGYDYKTTTRTIVFEPSNETIPKQQCLEIEIIDDSLPEDWEVFTLLLSTNNSAVDLTTPRVDVFILHNNGKFFCYDS